MRFSDFVQWFRSALANAFFQTVISKPGEGENTADVVLMAGQEGTETQSLTRLEQFGDVVCPPGARTQCFALTNAAQGFAMSLCDPATRPKDGKPGDRGLYSNKAGTRVHLYGAAATEPGLIRAENASGAQLLLRGDGSVNVNSASTKDIVLNGGTAKVSRVGDAGYSGDLTAETEQDMSMPPILTVRITYRSNDPASPYFLVAKTLLEFKVPGGTAVVPPVGTSEGVEVRGRNEEGADHVKA